jgi:drug/metabolite transporter (DMT)-like permease
MGQDRRQRRYRWIIVAGLSLFGLGVVLLLVSASTASHPSAPAGGGSGPTDDVSSVITAVAGLVSAVGGLITSIVALVAVRRSRGAAADPAASSAAGGVQRPRLWTPEDGPVPGPDDRRR